MLIVLANVFQQKIKYSQPLAQNTIQLSTVSFVFSAELLGNNNIQPELSAWVTLFFFYCFPKRKYLPVFLLPPMAQFCGTVLKEATFLFTEGLSRKLRTTFRVLVNYVWFFFFFLRRHQYTYALQPQPTSYAPSSPTHSRAHGSMHTDYPSSAL